MTKKYNSPMLQVVSIKKNDVIVTSPTLGADYNGETILAPGVRGIFDPSEEWANAGY